ncbi:MULTISPECIES: HWE histidine kinase domain-containing protein [unclassified Aminobacter]|uniref:HWE histidine kinase domain-containing protein n=1 Tax=unclassified Aminobacter TaxID=2644704 RepID=UPI00046666D7|nr:MULTISPECIES: HWE histidine kinase domain-containing protein [unclassified Aminobacter]TWH23157.1 PAS domain S-box-containing protein [Aminobacter sp. J15]
MPIERLRATGSFLREFVEAVPGAVYAKDRAGRIPLGNEAFAEAVGWQSGGFVGKNDLELLADKDLARTVMDNDQRIMAGHGRSQIEEMLRAEDGSTSYWLSTKAPFTDEDGNVAGLVGVSVDITERKRFEQQERLRAQEVEHRNKNLLGVVQSVVRLTEAATIEEFRETVVGRLDALDRVHGVFMRERRDRVDLKELLLEELAAYAPNNAGRVRLTGPRVWVGVDAAQPLGMAFHELATNATKYGAFANATGTLDVIWQLPQGNGAPLAIEWKETGGQPVETPDRQGFGTRLIRSVVEHQLHGTLSLGWEPSGLRCAISLPLQSIALD